MNISIKQIKNQSGFSLLEVLITILVMSIAMFGAVGMQVNAMKMGKSADYRNQAIVLASDLAERMEANKSEAIAGNYSIALATVAPGTATTCSRGCTNANMTQYDLTTWQQAVFNSLPTASWKVTSDPTMTPVIYTIELNWVDRRSKTTYSGTQVGESFSYTATRKISGL
jgi:type IV pilus assembly protein PilV